MAKQITDTKLDIMSFSRAELDAFISRMTDKGIPVCVNVPEELIRRIPTYIGNRVCFVNCESEAMLCNEASDLVINTEVGEAQPHMRLGEIGHGKSGILKPLAEEHEIPYFDKSLQKRKNWPENEHHDHYDVALGWTFLGKDDKYDYYVNHAWEYLSIVYGAEAHQYKSPEYHSFLEGAYKSYPYTKLRELYCTSPTTLGSLKDLI